MTQATLAERAGIDLCTLQDIEGAVYNPTWLTVVAVASSLKADLDTLAQPAKRVRPRSGRPPKRRP